MFNDHRLTRGGKRISVPRYYRKKILEELGEEYKELYQNMNFARDYEDVCKIVGEKFSGDFTRFYEIVWSDRDRRKAYFDRLEFEYRSKR